MSKTVTDDSSGDLYVACSDDDLYQPGGEDRGKLDWMPSPAEILKLYELLEKQGHLDLEWRCPGRRPPSPAQPEALPTQEEDEGEDTSAGLDFDFEDEAGSAPSVINTPQHRRPPGVDGLRGSARKKTTSLDSVLANMKKHRQIDEADTGANTNNKQN